jgi:inosose dehydratase
MTGAAPAASRAAPSIADAPLGGVPIVWNNADQHDLAPEVTASEVLDEMARLGYAGTQFGRGFPEADELRRELAARGLRLAEWYCALPATIDGITPDAERVAHDTLARLTAAGGEVLVVAIDGGGERDEWSGRVAEDTPRWGPGALEELVELLDHLARLAEPRGVRVAFHPHTATWIEAPDEGYALADALRGSAAGICLDVGHWLVGGGDPVEAIDRLGEQVVHVHAKDVDPRVLVRLRAGELSGFGHAVRERIFTELGNGLLDLDGVLAALARAGYRGWLMVEQDSSWLPPAEAAAVGLRVLQFARRRLLAGQG